MHVLIYISCTQIELGKRKKSTTTTKDAKKHRRTEELQVPAVSDQVNEPGGITKNIVKIVLFMQLSSEKI